MTSKAYRENYNLIDWSKEITVERKERLPVSRSDLPRPFVISDTMAPTQHVDGQTYTSKRAYDVTTKAHGYIEIGNEKLPIKKPDRQKNKAKNLEAVKRARSLVNLTS